MTGGTGRTAHWIAADLQPGRACAWAMEGSRVQATARDMDVPDPRVEGAVEKALIRLIADWLQPGPGSEPVTVVISGFTGADAPPLVPVPAKPLDIPPVPAPSFHDPRLRVFAVAGLKQATPPAVMQGAETRIAGFLSLNPGWDGVICLPGPVTHWAQVSAGEIVSFQSVLSGDLFAAISRNTLLRPALAGDGWDEEGFAEALDDTMSRPERLAARLAGLYAQNLLAPQPPGDARARLSGLLIGAELAAARPYWLGQKLAVIAGGDAAKPYVAALARHGAPATVADADRMTLAGLSRAWRRLCGQD